MQVSTSSSSYTQQELQKLLAGLQSQQAGQTNQAAQVGQAGQDLPSSGGPVGKGGHHHGGHHGPPPSAGASDQFASDTLSSLLGVQQDEPTSTDVADQLIADLDQDGDGSLSLDETNGALSSKSGKAVDASTAFAKLDTDGDGKLGSTELATALDSYIAKQQAQRAQNVPQAGSGLEVAA